MTPELEALARRAVACPRWRWMPGARVVPILADDTIEAVSGTIVADRGLLLVYWPDVGLRWQGAREHLLPDLTDPATLGCLLALVREAWADQCACVFSIDYGPAGVMWQVRLTANGRQVTPRHYAAEAEALVAALDAALKVGA